jgi:hypothetical protein
MLVAACGGVDAADTPTTASSMPESAAPSLAEPSLPVTFADARGDVVTVESIERIMPLDGDLAEVVFALGLGDRVVATDLSATFPPEADALPEIGYQRSLSAEPIAAFEPTVLLATDLAGSRRDARPAARSRLSARDDRSADRREWAVNQDPPGRRGTRHPRARRSARPRRPSRDRLGERGRGRRVRRR